MSKKITSQEVKRSLKRIVNERGYEYVYEYPEYTDEYGETDASATCLYSDKEGRPSCIVGVLLSETVPDVFRELHQSEWEDYTPLSTTVPNLTSVFGIGLREYFDDDALSILARVQNHQDDGVSWGEAVDAVVERN